ncbi:MAG: 2-hydroxyacyl-CoA dehydratase [Pirellulales bacterium]|nr:2-hydroxyacyl-CoA dehydratase [Pirellulales bacterium]
MTQPPRCLSLDQWDRRYAELCAAGMREPSYGGCLRRHVEDGDDRLLHLKMDDSPAALRLWNFLLSEEDRLREAQASGKRLVGAMKDLGTVPVMVYALDNLIAFYPDGAWWLPCIMEHGDGLLRIADSLGVDDSFCPVRAMLGAFENEAHFPIPELLVSSVGATCDDFSAIAQRLEAMGHPIFWWEIPHRRPPEPDEPSVLLPGMFRAAQSQVAFVQSELERVRRRLEEYAGKSLSDDDLSAGIHRANLVRRKLATLREIVFKAARAPLPSLEMLVAEMLAIHFCSDQYECLVVLDELIAEAGRRAVDDVGVTDEEAVRVFWVNPVADLRVMNLLEDAGGRICGTEYLFSHALDLLPQHVPPMEALARAALADPMVGSARDRAARVCRDMRAFGAEALVVSRIPGASHCAMEGPLIRDVVRRELGVPVLEIEVPTLIDTMTPTLQTRLEALVETVKRGRV